jgi:metallo-beta-lactamase family protein
VEIEFLGAAETVTGSKTLVRADGATLLVDCGLFQGVKNLRLRNWASLPVTPGEIDAVVLTHAHLDHSGFLPRLVREGFTGPVYATPPTIDLAGILLPDAGRIHEEDADYANRKGFTRHRPALPLFDEADARASLERFVPLEVGRSRAIGPFEVRLSSAGHILGATSVSVRHRRGSVLFSGDLGREDDLLMHPPQPPGSHDVVVIESTYGDRLHPDFDPHAEVAAIMRRTFERHGILLIPSFAVGRTQTMLLCLHRIFEAGLAPRVPVFLNSPMATNATALYQAHAGAHRLDPDTCARVFDMARYVGSPAESRELSARREPCVIVSASGMGTGGRVLHHLRALAPNERNTILLPGFMAPGTRGDALAHGATEIKIFGDYVPVAAEVIQLDGFSAHADQRGLLDWIRRCDPVPRQVFVNHGERVPADTLRRRIGEALGCEVRVAMLGERVAVG